MFNPIGDQPQWQVIYERLSTMEIGDVIKDTELAELLPLAAEGSYRSAFHRAVRQVEDDKRRTFARVRSVGYRMVEAIEHISLAKGQHRKAKRSLGRAQRKLHSADRTLLSREDRQRVDALEEHVVRQQEMIRRLSAAQEKTEARVSVTEKETAAVNDRIDRLTALLERHGITTT